MLGPCVAAGVTGMEAAVGDVDRSGDVRLSDIELHLRPLRRGCDGRMTTIWSGGSRSQPLLYSPVP